MLSGFELCPRWVPLVDNPNLTKIALGCYLGSHFERATTLKQPKFF